MEARVNGHTGAQRMERARRLMRAADLLLMRIDQRVRTRTVKGGA
jgi:hypothetical protein